MINIDRPDAPTFRATTALALEQTAFLSTLLAVGAVLVSATTSAGHGEVAVLSAVGTLLALAVFYCVLAWRWNAEGLVYCAQAAFIGSYMAYRATRPLPEALDAVALVVLCFCKFGLAELLQRLGFDLYARPIRYVSLCLPLVSLALAVHRGWLHDLNVFVFFATASFYGLICAVRHWKPVGYAAAILYDALLWIVWARAGWKLIDHPQFYLIPVGFTAILFAEVNRQEFGREVTSAIRSLGLVVIYVSLAIPMWHFQSFGAWVTLLLLSLLGVFAGIGLRVRSFLSLGLVCFCFDVLYQLGRFGLEHAFARWGIMLGLGILLTLFVALNEKKRIVAKMWEYYEQVREWE
jgi:hypothetical protein